MFLESQVEPAFLKTDSLFALKCENEKCNEARALLKQPGERIHYMPPGCLVIGAYEIALYFTMKILSRWDGLWYLYGIFITSLRRLLLALSGADF